MKIKFIQYIQLNEIKVVKGQVIEVNTSQTKPTSLEIQKEIEKTTGKSQCVGFGEGRTHEVL